MSRTGNNPAKFSPGIKLPGAVMTVTTCLPNTDGYHAERFDVIRLCLNSMRDRAGIPHKVMVWDNGSCSLLTDWLREEYKPDYLMLSENVGKTNARTMISRLFHPDTIIGLSDDDMYFYEGWLKESLLLMKGFPSVGMVSAYPVRTQFRWGCKNTIETCRKIGDVKVGKFIDEQWDRDFCASIGREYEEQLKTTINDMDYIVSYKGLTAFATAHHCQYIAYAGVLAKFPEWTTKLLSPERGLDDAVDNAGLLRLTTRQRFARHMGNVIDDDIREDAVESGYLERIIA